jgi:CheY-like chemotaxis protein
LPSRKKGFLPSGGGEFHKMGNDVQARKKMVLIVDEAESIRFIISEILQPLGYEIDTAENAEAALQKIESNHYDLIITDYTVPKINGLELTRRINKIYPSLPIFAFATEGLSDKFLESGALACLKKPFNIPEIQILSRAILSDACSTS